MTRTRFASFTLGACVAAVCLGAACGGVAAAKGDPADAGLSASDRAAILALDSTFVDGWLKDDTAKVLSVFDSSAVLMPPNSVTVNGVAAIRAFWWPTDGSHTRITSFQRSIAEVGGSGSHAYVRGTGTLGWTYAKKGEQPKAQTSRSNDLMLYARDATGRWRVTRQIWNALP